MQNNNPENLKCKKKCDLTNNVGRSPNRNTMLQWKQWHKSWRQVWETSYVSDPPRVNSLFKLHKHIYKPRALPLPKTAGHLNWQVHSQLTVSCFSVVIAWLLNSTKIIAKHFFFYPPSPPPPLLAELTQAIILIICHFSMIIFTATGKYSRFQCLFIIQLEANLLK